MNYTIWIGDDRCVIYKPDFGIVLNTKTELMGGGRVDVARARAFLVDAMKRLDTRRSTQFTFLTPVELTESELNEYKQVAYTSGMHNVQFVPAVVWVGNGLVVFIGEGSTDVALVHNGKVLRSIRTVGLSAAKFGIDNKAFADLATLFAVDITPGAENIRMAIEPTFKKIVSKVKSLLRVTEPELLTNIVNGNVLICAPFINLPGLRQFFSRELEIDVRLVDCFPDAT